MSWLARREVKPERIDQPEGLPDREIRQTLRELELVNRWLGGARAVLACCGPRLKEMRRRKRTSPIRIADLGCGGGDIAASLVRWARRHGIPVQIVALDLEPRTCRWAKDRTRAFPEIQVVQADLRTLPLKHCSVDLILCSAFLHHFSDEELPRLLRQLGSAAAEGILISDLRRSLAAYLGIRLLTGLFSRSAAVRHDGPLSVAKGFRRPELLELANRAGLGIRTLKRRWAFRFVLELEPLQLPPDRMS